MAISIRFMTKYNFKEIRNNEFSGGMAKVIIYVLQGNLNYKRPR